MQTRRTPTLVATGSVLLAYVALAASAEQAQRGRIDVYAVNGAVEFSNPKGSAFTESGFCAFLGVGKERTGVSAERPLGKDWEEISIQFTALGDGAADIQLQSEWYGMAAADDIRLAWVDNVRVDGADIANGDFEQVGSDGRPANWRLTGDFPRERYSRDGKVAQSGKSCIAIWYGSAARQTFPVRKGATYRVQGWFRVLDPKLVKQPSRVRFESLPEMYTQDLDVVFASEQAAQRAAVSMTPLFDGREWAVSSRWDDNNGSDVEMRDVLLKHGHSGTFYLNSLWPDWSSVTPKVDSAFGRDLLRGGCSLGGHSLTHPLLSYCSRNRIFEEIAGVRMIWEAAADTLVNSYAFSYCNFANPQEGDIVHADIARALERAGFYDVANEPSFADVRSDLILSPIMPADGADIDGWVEGALGSDGFRIEHPNLTYSMHAWYRTPEAWAKFEGQLDKYGHNPRWWYCNQNQYGAYRLQYQHSKIVHARVKGNVLHLRLQRPALLDVNDSTPLTFRVADASRDEVREVRCATARVDVSQTPGAAFLFHLHQDRDQRLPAKIGMVAPNTTNRAALAPNDYDEDFPGVRALLSCTGGRLRLMLDNQSKQPLRVMRITYRLPLAWQGGIIRRHVPDLPAGARREETCTLVLASDDYKLMGGRHFFIAQVDFRDRARPARLYASCEATLVERDASYPQGGFLHLGPIGQNMADPAKVAADIIAGRIGTQPWDLADDSRLQWQSTDSADTPPYLDAELIRLSGQWGGQTATHLLQSTLVSPLQQAVKLHFVRGAYLRMILNGQDVPDPAIVALNKGDNRLFLLANDSTACFLRLLDPKTGARVTNVRFEPRAPASPSGEPYRPVPISDATRKTLTGKWHARLTLKLPATTEGAFHPDPGLTAAAKAAVAPEADDSAWPLLDVPKRWSEYGGEWAASDGEAVFRRVVTIPEVWARRDLTLSLGPVDDFDDTFFNGELVGRTDKATPEFYAAPRLYTVPGHLVKPGANVLAVRIFDHFGDGGLTGKAEDIWVGVK